MRKVTWLPCSASFHLHPNLTTHSNFIQLWVWLIAISIENVDADSLEEKKWKKIHLTYVKLLYVWGMHALGVVSFLLPREKRRERILAWPGMPSHHLFNSAGEINLFSLTPPLPFPSFIFTRKKRRNKNESERNKLASLRFGSPCMHACEIYLLRSKNHSFFFSVRVWVCSFTSFFFGARQKRRILQEVMGKGGKWS